MSRPRNPPASEHLSDEDFVHLLAFRDSLRRFLHWSEERAHDAGITPAQHQLLLAVRGHGSPPSMSDVATHLLLRHHSTVELVDRAKRAGLVKRIDDDADHRIVRIGLTAKGNRCLNALTEAHLEELSKIGERLAAVGEPRSQGDVGQ